ncbi:MAG: hypothetical protein RJA70_3802 [Pseudomonadota bacterium]|jgi:GTP pyrophosphokinase
MLLGPQLVQRVQGYLPSADLGVVLEAYDFAQHAHRAQTRKSGEPYFVHPVAVAENIADMQLDIASVCAGLLHDVVEDTEVPIEEIDGRFGGEIAELVDGLTKLNKINFYAKEDRQAENFRKMVVAMARDVRVLLVKLCDRLDNMRTMEHMKVESQERISRETQEIYAPLAHRLGMHNVKAELEDHSLRYLEPEVYKEIVSKLEASEKDHQKYIQGVGRTIETLLGQRGFSCTVQGSPRHVSSVYRKMRAVNCTYEQLHDLIAFQVCVESSSDCYTSLGVMHSRWTPVPGRFKDYIALPKPNRYQSLHTTVIGPGKQRLEVQIRTPEMHRVAEQGVVAHWENRHKLSGRVRPDEASKYSWLQEMQIFQKELKDPAEFLEIVKSDLCADEVFVFTPKNDLRVFPRGSTPLDFAYSVHSQLGDHCVGARVNGQQVSMRHRLRNGDVVEVLTDDAQAPCKDWLEGCVTPRARHRIRNYLRIQNRRKSINLGKELLETEMQRGGMSLAKLLKNSAVMTEVLEAFKAEDADELLLAIGFGKHDALEVVTLVKQLKEQASGKAGGATLATGALEKIVRKVTGRDVGGIQVGGIRVDELDSVLARYAKCCNPLPGDPIMGFVTRGRGVSVHRRDCTKAFDTTDPERRVEVRWSSSPAINRPVSLRVTTINSFGILAKVSEAFSSQKINLSEATCRASDDGNAQNVFTFMASDVAQLRALMRSLAKVAGVVSVERV